MKIIILLSVLSIAIFILMAYVLRLRFNSQQKKMSLVMFIILFSVVFYVFYRYAVFTQSQEVSSMRNELEICHNWQKNIKNLKQLCEAYRSNSLYKDSGKQAFPAYSAKAVECAVQVKSMRERFSEHYRKNLQIASYYADAARQEEKGIVENTAKKNFFKKVFKYVLPDNTGEKIKTRKFLYECQRNNISE